MEQYLLPIISLLVSTTFTVGAVIFTSGKMAERIENIRYIHSQHETNMADTIRRLHSRIDTNETAIQGRVREQDCLERGKHFDLRFSDLQGNVCKKLDSLEDNQTKMYLRLVEISENMAVLNAVKEGRNASSS